MLLFRKKLDPNASRMDQPDAASRRWAYMVPPPAPANVTWVVPPRTAQWVAQLVASHGQSTALLTADRDGRFPPPAISPDHWAQIAAIARSARRMHVALLIWDAAAQPQPKLFSLTAELAPGHVLQADQCSADSVAVPPDVRAELMKFGYIYPPSRIVFLSAEFSGDPAAHPFQLDVRYSGPPAGRHATITFTAPA